VIRGFRLPFDPSAEPAVTRRIESASKGKSMRFRILFTSVAVIAVAGLAGCSTVRDGGGSTPGTATLVGVVWNLDSYRVGTLAAIDASPTAPASLTFETDGRISGSTGCNSFGATYTVDRYNLTISLGAMTQMACGDPAVVAQEAAIREHLPNVTSYSIVGDSLALAGGNDLVLLTFTPGISGLANSSWQVTGVNNGKGGLETTALTANLTAAFDADNQFSGSGGCNRLFGPYTTTGSNALTIGPLSSTLIGCTSDISRLEAHYSEALGRVARYEIRGSVLTMLDSGDAMQVTATLAHEK
jgi:heat shock protein HslJ